MQVGTKIKYEKDGTVLHGEIIGLVNPAKAHVKWDNETFGYAYLEFCSEDTTTKELKVEVKEHKPKKNVKKAKAK